ncbi:MAG: hypothetical protein Q8O19_08210 [Rectinemataceae bacterium]|nr:hypothetical protein [Rectinemataceae bacterium]
MERKKPEIKSARDAAIAEFKRALIPFLETDVGKLDYHNSVEIKFGPTGNEAMIGIPKIGGLRQVDALLPLTEEGFKSLLGRFRRKVIFRDDLSKGGDPPK